MKHKRATPTNGRTTTEAFEEQVDGPLERALRLASVHRRANTPIHAGGRAHPGHLRSLLAGRYELTIIDLYLQPEEARRRRSSSSPRSSSKSRRPCGYSSGT